MKLRLGREKPTSATTSTTPPAAATATSSSAPTTITSLLLLLLLLVLLLILPQQVRADPAVGQRPGLTLSMTMARVSLGHKVGLGVGMNPVRLRGCPV